MNNFWKKHRADAIAIAFFGVLGLSLAIYAAAPKRQSFSSLYAEITLDSKRLEKNGYLDLSRYGQEEEHLEIMGKHSKMILGLKHNAIHVEHSDCPSHFCIGQGWVSAPGTPIICAYNHIVITILGATGNDINV